MKLAGRMAEWEDGERMSEDRGRRSAGRGRISEVIPCLQIYLQFFSGAVGVAYL
jgi:hypothetical protein